MNTFKNPLLIITIIFITSGLIFAAGLILIDKQLALQQALVIVGYILIVIGAILCLIGNIMLFFYLKI